MVCAADGDPASSADEADTTKSRQGCGSKLWFKFARQQTPGHRTVFSLRFAIGLFMAMSLGFLGGGIALLSVTLSQVELRVTYSDQGSFQELNDTQRSAVLQGDPNVMSNGVRVSMPPTTTLKVEVKEDMEAPIQVYYVLHNFYQNHKRYVRSVNYDQLHGNSVSYSSLSDCIPQRVLASGALESYENVTDDGVVDPCGLIAWSLFNDTFTDWQVTPAGQDVNETIVLNSDKLVWDSDRDTFYGDVFPVNHNTLEQYRGGRALNQSIAFNEDEHFMAWMRPAAHPTVRKFYGDISRDLKKGDVLWFTVTNQYNTYEFSGKKSLLITTRSAFGNRNLTFGIVWLVMGALCVVITITYFVMGWQDLSNVKGREKRIRDLWGETRGNFSTNMRESLRRRSAR